LVICLQEQHQLAQESGVENPQVSVLKTRNLELEANFQVNQRQLDGLNRQLANRNGLMQFSRSNKSKRSLKSLLLVRISGGREYLAKTKALAEVASADARRFSFWLVRGSWRFHSRKESRWQSRHLQKLRLHRHG
jgi:capsule polysaccharide export protein KpsE/RkpR